MKISRPGPELLILRHGPSPALLIPAALLAWTGFLGFREGVVAGGFALAWIAVVASLCIRRLEIVRAEFDTAAGQVDIHRRTGLCSDYRLRYDPGASPRVKVSESERWGIARFQLILVIRDGPDTGQHPLHLNAIQDDLTDLALDLSYWLKRPA